MRCHAVNYASLGRLPRTKTFLPQNATCLLAMVMLLAGINIGKQLTAPDPTSTTTAGASDFLTPPDPRSPRPPARAVDPATNSSTVVSTESGEESRNCLNDPDFECNVTSRDYI